MFGTQRSVQWSSCWKTDWVYQPWGEPKCHWVSTQIVKPLETMKWVRANRRHLWEFLERECVCVKGGSLRQTLALVELSGCQPCLVVLREFPGLSSAVEPHSLRAHVRLSTDVHMHTHAQSHHLDAAVGRWGQRAMAMECWRNLKRKGEGGQIQ